MSDLTGFLDSLRGKRILGLNPPVRDFAFFDLWAKPLGLLYILDRLRDQGNAVSLVDCVHEAKGQPKTFGRWAPRRYEIKKPEPYKNIPRRYWHFGLNREELESRLQSLPRPDVILVTSSMTYWYPGVFWCLGVIHDSMPSVPILLGGAYPVLCPEHALKSGADYVQTVPMPLPPSMPAMDLYGSLSYGVALTSTGCPGGCSYCASRILWPEFRMRDIHDVLNEISMQVGLGAEDIAFYDDALLADKERRFLPLCAALRERFPGVRFHTPNGMHVREIDEECALALFETGFSTIRLSLEGTDPVSFKAGEEKANPQEYAEAVANLRKAGFSSEQIETYVLIGLPGQKIQSIAETIRFVQSLEGRAKIAQYSPIPGTKLFHGLLPRHPELAREPLLQNNTVFAPFVSGYVTPEDLQSLKDLARYPR
ncbi:MAG: B12-binding domain-containing radical SAM protein [Thermovirgaceae bacterium]|nr:B12-binding domain-containing radical SAM protein [Thermovirgaceae bacterium]